MKEKTIYAETLLEALRVAIDKQREKEKEMGFDWDSGMVTVWDEIANEIKEHMKNNTSDGKITIRIE